MILTATTTLDLVGKTSTISFYESATLVDQITFASNTITYQSISTYNLSKSDMALYFSFLNTFLLSLYTNFPTLAQNTNLIFPNCVFNITRSFAGVTHLTYTQSSNGNNLLTINYVPVAVAGSWTSRSAVTISIQEFIFGVTAQRQYFNQVSLN